MPRSDAHIIEVAGSALATLDAELSATRARQLVSVTAATASGSANMDATFGMDVRFRLVFVRCHFTGSAGENALSISLDSITGAAFDAKLYSILRAGVGFDVNFRIPAYESEDPSPWTFQAGDRIRVQWTNPGGVSWGLEVGLVLAS